ncbi:MAG TPA: hypothetical protein VFH58_17440 [Acidimicrobiales bacterium]|nr:hypothetical protein [Acidimicrobiales bacterium]
MHAAASKIASVVGVFALGLGFTVSSGPVASATPSNAVNWAQANFHGYSSGDELHLGALTVSGQSVADTELAFSGASTNTAGLGTPVVGDNGGTPGTGLLVQPVKAATNKAFGTGGGLEVGLVAPADASGDQLKLAGLATQVAPPNGPAVVDSIPSASCPETNGVPQCLSLPAGLVSVGALSSEGAAVFDSTVCPLGQPISYSFGDAADASVLSYAASDPITSTLATILKQLDLTAPTSGYVVQNLGDTRTTSETYLTPNGDGTFGLTTRAWTTIAPLDVNLFGVATLHVILGGQLNSAGTANPAVPLSLTATTTGESSGAKVTLGANDLVTVKLSIAGQPDATLIPATSLDDLIGQGGLVINLDPQTLVGQLATAVNQNPVLAQLGSAGSTLGSLLNQLSTSLQPVTSQLPDVSLGQIAIGTPVRAINSAPSTKSTATTTGGTSASGAFDLARITLAPSAQGTSTATLANLYVGHLEAASNLAAPILCSLPVIKSSDPTAVTAGNTFNYDIQVPDPAKLDLIDCNLDNVTVTDTITDYQGTPTFTVTEAVDTASGQKGTIQQVGANDWTVTWTGLSYKVAATGQPPNPPIPLRITVSVPATSPAGVIKDNVVATGVASGCQGGVAGTTDASAAAGNNATLTGSFTLNQPSVAAGAAPAASAPAKALPFTGAMGGLWQPLGGLAALAAGGGALALVRRSRRLGGK